MAKLMAKPRTETGSRASRRLRREGLIPAIIYGHGEEPEPITVSEHDLEVALIHGERLLEVDVDGKIQNALVKDVQWDLFGHAVIHVDLARVDLDERVEVAVPVMLRGTPAGTREGGVLTQTVSEVNVECPVRSIPEEFVVSVTELNIGDRLSLSDLELPEGLTLLDEGGDMLCQVEFVEEEVVEAAAEEEIAAEPELIGEEPEEAGEAPAPEPEEE